MGSRGVAIAVALATCTARADAPRPVRRPDATWGEIFGGPFTTSRLFAMPVADVVGPYQLSVSGEGSLLADAGALSGSAVVAIGFGDVAQLEYRLQAAVSALAPDPVPLGSLGVQLKAPFAERRYLPAVAAALRLGLPRAERSRGQRYREKVDDLYLVGRLRLWGPFARVTLHGGVRIGAASIEAEAGRTKETLILPAAGWEWQAFDRARFVGEVALVPTLDAVAADPEARIGAKPFGRLGVRWQVHPAFIVDASLGYRLEVARVDQSPVESARSVVDWDIRLGGELFVPWGALLCLTGGVFCE